MTQLITTVNPATGEQIKEFEVMSRKQVDDIISKARSAADTWRDTPVEGRSRMLKKIGRRFLSHKKDLSHTITEEMGKPIKESVAEVEKCSLVCTYFGKKAKKFLKNERVKTEYHKSYVSFEPLGVVGAIMPWNFPVWQIMRCAAPALVAGNAVVVKPSSVTPECGQKIAKLFEKCKFPEGVFNVVIGDSTVGTTLVNGGIDAISLTGSVEAGSKVAAAAAAGIKSIVLELGGSDPFIVLADADIEEASQQAVVGRFLNCGQSCIAAKRFIVHKDIASAFTEKFVEKVKELNVGDPMKQDTDIGPLVREEQLQKIDKQILDSILQGAKTLLGGKKIEGQGFFFQPTVLGNVTNSMPVCREETFGPVAPIVVVENEDMAIQVANDTDFGLGASVWTTNLDRAELIAKKLQAGNVYINRSVRSDPRLPFGGIKKSGIGRELSRYGILEFVNMKSVIVNMPAKKDEKKEAKKEEKK